jgi:hypothetical protein
MLEVGSVGSVGNVELEDRRSLPNKRDCLLFHITTATGWWVERLDSSAEKIAPQCDYRGIIIY